MKLSPPPLNEHPTFAQDILNRRAFGEELRKVIANVQEPLVIALDAKWGEGKTTFVRMWQDLLNKSKIPNIYIDAFSHDYLDDPFLAIVNSIIDYTEKRKNKSLEEKEKLLSDFIGKSKKVGVQLLPIASKIAIKTMTLGAIQNADIDCIQKVQDDIAQSVSKITEDSLQKLITAHAEDIENVSAFRATLSNLPHQLTESSNNKDTKPLVIIVDELDRCKPTYAVAIVERIKHFFSVPNVMFVLVMHKIQLEESIKVLYGGNIDAHNYLQKFINVEVQLPKNIYSSHNNDLLIYSEKLFAWHQLQTKNNGFFLKLITELAIHANLSLRQLEKVFINCAVYYATRSEHDYDLIPIIIFLAVVRVINPHLFLDLLNKNASLNNVAQEMSFVDAGLLSEDLLFDSPNKVIYLWVSYVLIEESDVNYQLIIDLAEKHLDVKNAAFIFRGKKEIVPFIARKMTFLSVSE